MSHESGGFKYKTEIGGGKDSYDGGKRYKGRGYIQLTHKYNYKYYGDKLGLDLVNKPELAEGGETAAKIALLYWTENVRPTVNGNWDNVFLHSNSLLTILLLNNLPMSMEWKTDSRDMMHMSRNLV